MRPGPHGYPQFEALPSPRTARRCYAGAPPTPELWRNPSPVRAASRCHYITTRCTRLFCLRSSCCTFGVLLCSLQHGCALRHFPLISTLTSPEGRGFTALQGPSKEIAATWKPGIQT